MNPAVTLALWRLRAFPGRAVATYVVAQLGGSVAGTVLARLAWGPAVARVGYGAAAAAPSWNGWAVFAAEAACLVVVTLVIGYFLVHPDRERWFPRCWPFSSARSWPSSAPSAAAPPIRPASSAPC